MWVNLKECKVAIPTILPKKTCRITPFFKRQNNIKYDNIFVWKSFFFMRQNLSGRKQLIIVSFLRGDVSKAAMGTGTETFGTIGNALLFKPDCLFT